MGLFVFCSLEFLSTIYNNCFDIIKSSKQVYFDSRFKGGQKVKKFLFLFLMLFLSGCSANQTSLSSNTEGNPNKTITVIAENLNVPWSIQKSGETWYVSERPGTIAVIRENEVDRQEVRFEKELADVSEAGLLGFELTPDFEQSGEAFAYYSYHQEGRIRNRVVVLAQKENRWEENRLLLDDIPGGNTHDGGRIKIGPDQKLYVTTGDAGEKEEAQNKNTLNGKILRMNQDGTVPEDNPFPGSYIYSYGHRNPQGLAWSADGTMYASEHGNQANDEINRIEHGKNYGWPVIQGEQEQKGMETPLMTSGSNQTWAPSGLVIQKDTLYVAGLRGKAIFKFDLETEKIQNMSEGMDRIRDIWLEGEYLYFISNNTDGRGSPRQGDDKLYRLKLFDKQ